MDRDESRADESYWGRDRSVVRRPEVPDSDQLRRELTEAAAGQGGDSW
jgi:hypothetical protein